MSEALGLDRIDFQSVSRRPAAEPALISGPTDNNVSRITANVLRRFLA